MNKLTKKSYLERELQEFMTLVFATRKSLAVSFGWLASPTLTSFKAEPGSAPCRFDQHGNGIPSKNSGWPLLAPFANINPMGIQTTPSSCLLRFLRRCSQWSPRWGRRPCQCPRRHQQGRRSEVQSLVCFFSSFFCFSGIFIFLKWALVKGRLEFLFGFL